jgi:UDP-glucose 4-epimerase
MKKLGSSIPRLVLVGRSSFIGAAIAREASRQGVAAVAIDRRKFCGNDLSADDIVVDCTLDPIYRTSPYDPAFDREWITAQLAARVGARVLMLSSRKVYRDFDRWGADESAPASGDGSHYGLNKATTERNITRILGDRVCILRLSNVFGYEYSDAIAPRTSFFGRMMHSLYHEDVINFDMSPDTFRDFIPVDAVARAVIDVVKSCASGVYNIGGGFPLRCSDLATALIAGYGQGKLHWTTDHKRDEFFLNTRKWVAEFGPLASETKILMFTRQLGEQLACAKLSLLEAPGL